MKKIELLAPAGDLERLKMAIMYGADAVFVGGKRFSLRSRASNFELEDIAEGVRFANQYGSHIHVTINMLPHDSDLDGLKEYIEALEEIGVTAVICASLHIATKAMKYTDKMEVHLSTQQSTLNSLAVKFYEDLGIDRVVLGREVSMDDIEHVMDHVNIDIETFVHGGMCSNLSGRCTLSNYMTLRDANRGGCAQSCRWKYEVYEKQDKISDDEVLFSMSSKDLMAAEYIPRLIDAGVSSLKIEGRMKSLYYIATVVRGYRHLIDEYYQSKAISNERMQFHINEITRAENRLTDIGFYDGDPNEEGHLYGVNGSGVTHDFLGLVISQEQDETIIEVRNKFEVGDTLEFVGPELETYRYQFEGGYNDKGEFITVCNNPMVRLKININVALEPYYLIRKG